MKGRSRFAAVMIVAFSVLALGLYLWAGAKRAQLPGYGFMHEDGQQLAVNFGSHIVWLDAAGREQAAIDLAELDIVPVGDFGFFSDGDLLLYHRAERLSFWDNLAAFLRLRSTRTSGASSEDGFYRCELALERCQPLAQSEQYPARSFRLLLEPASDIIYLADTASHALYKLSPEGRELAKNDRDFRFPNQLLWHKGDVWLADTNHHRVVQVATATDQFGRERQAFTARLNGEYRWPHQLAADGDGMWVLIGNSAMAEGRLQLYSWSGEPLTALALSGLTDPLAIYSWSKHLWVNDFAEPILLKVEPKTGVTERVESPTLARLSAQVRHDKHYLRRFEWLAIGLFGCVLFCGFAAAWILEKDQTRRRLKTLGESAVDMSSAGEIEPTGQRDIMWIASRIKWYHWWLARSCWVMAAAMLVILGVNYRSLISMPSIVWVSVGTAAFMAMAGVMATQLLTSIAGAKLGVIGESLVLVSAKGARTIARGTDLAYSPQFIFAEGVAVALGNPQMRFWDEQALQRWVYPRLKAAQKLTGAQQTKRLWRLRHPQLMWPVALGAVMVLAALALKLYT
jgi:hypothetical protein